MLSVAIVGASGFVGAALVHALEGTGQRAVRRMSRPEFDLLRSETWHAPEPLDCAVIATGLIEGTDEDLRRVNCDAPAALAGWLRSAGVRKLVLLSSGAVYGNANATKQHPGLPAAPVSAYGRSKLDGEMAVSRIWPAHALSIIRLYFPYGPGQRKTRLVPRLLELVRAGRPVVCRPDGGPLLSLTYVEDVCDVLTRDFILSDRPGVFNVAGPEAVSIESLAWELGRVLEIEPVLDRTGLAADCVSEAYDRPLAWHSLSLTDLTRGCRG